MRSLGHFQYFDPYILGRPNLGEIFQEYLWHMDSDLKKKLMIEAEEVLVPNVLSEGKLLTFSQE